MKTLSFGWYARSTRRSNLPPGWHPGRKRSSSATFKLGHQERCVFMTLRDLKKAHGGRCSTETTGINSYTLTASRSTLITRPGSWSGETRRHRAQSASVMPRGSFMGWWRGTRTPVFSGLTFIGLYWSLYLSQWGCKDIAAPSRRWAHILRETFTIKAFACLGNSRMPFVDTKTATWCFVTRWTGSSSTVAMNQLLWHN